MFNLTIKTILRIIPPGIYNGIIWTLSSMPLNINIQGIDKTAHIIEYSGLGFLMAFGFGVTRENFETKALYSMLLSLLIGITDEIHQQFVPTRSMDFLDLMADLIGITFGILCWLAFFNILNFVKTKFKAKLQ